MAQGNQSQGFLTVEEALAGVTQWIEHELGTKGSPVSVSYSQGEYLPVLWARSPGEGAQEATTH